MNILDILRTKRDGDRLDDGQIRWFIDELSQDRIPDYQAAALLMAICIRGMAPEELSTWTQAMISSGQTLDLTGVGRPTVDKHSTGGVGDKVSLILVPLVAACGAAVPQLSGRGLGHTGGTLDKLESISGWRADIATDDMMRQLSEIGGVIVGATAAIAPADRRLYALRDVTATVESIPLIASSIMSKKIAEGTGALVLDVKVGSGAFLPEFGQARELAETMVGIGESHGVSTTALITRMDTVLGRAAGNAVEVEESLRTLDGAGPADVVEVTVALAREMVRLAGIEADPAAVLASGAARGVFDAMIAAQGGDLTESLPEASHRDTIIADRPGFVTRLDCRSVGVAAWQLGAGRTRKEDPVSATAGVICMKKPGEPVESGEPVIELRSDDPDRFAGARVSLREAIDIDPEPPTPVPLVVETIRV